MKQRLRGLEERLRQSSDALEEHRRQAESAIYSWGNEPSTSQVEEIIQFVNVYRVGKWRSDHPVLEVPPSLVRFLGAQAACVRARAAEHLQDAPKRLVGVFEAELERRYGSIEQAAQSLADMGQGEVDELERAFAVRYEQAVEHLGPWEGRGFPKKWLPANGT